MTAEGLFVIRKVKEDQSFVLVRNAFGSPIVYSAVTIEAELERLNASAPAGIGYTPAIWRA